MCTGKSKFFVFQIFFIISAFILLSFNTCSARILFCNYDYDGDGYTPCSGDCNDYDSYVYPGAPELCDGIDNNCDGVILYSEQDYDQDGYMICAGDCNDHNPATYPGASEICDGEDNNCNGRMPFEEEDYDQDGYLICEGDCNDFNSDVYPGSLRCLIARVIIDLID